MKKHIKEVGVYLLIIFVACASCNKFINVVPDNVPTINFAFRLKSQAKKALFTCYSYLPEFSDEGHNVGFMGGDEIWVNEKTAYFGSHQIAINNQNIVHPYLNFWTGASGASDLYEGIRQCNIFIENIDQVPDMQQFEKNRWKAEAKFLKAYYLFYLTRMYGPVIVVKKNLPVSVSKGEVQKARDPVDTCFSYIVQLLNEVIATPELPDRIQNAFLDEGRITKAIAYAVKAKVLVTWASPLYNGNGDYKGFTNRNGTHLFDPEFHSYRWDSAAAVCKQAINFVRSAGYRLYQFTPPVSLSGMNDTTRVKMSIRQSVTAGRGIENSGAIWVYSDGSTTRLQLECLPYGINPDYPTNGNTLERFSPPLKIVEMFYTNHGLPLKSDVTWDYSERLQLDTVGRDSRYNMHEGYTTVRLNFHRGPRFYADLSFDGGIVYGAGIYDDSDPRQLHYLEAKMGETNGRHGQLQYAITGYIVKKLLNYQTSIPDGPGRSVNEYNWPIFRLADLYLLYAEAKNEAEGPGAEVYTYINKVRERAGLPTVQESWEKWSNDPKKFTTKKGMREIIHKERLIELAFEGQRFWDLRRWKEALTQLNQPIIGWDIEQKTAQAYYRKRLLFQQKFTVRDYFWPLSERMLLTNPKLVQNPGW